MEQRNYTVIYRIIHWAIAICMMLLLLTIFLRLTWMNRESMAEIIKNYLATTDQTLSQEQLGQLSRQLRRPMWEWHMYIGYVLTGLFFLRFILPFFGEMKFMSPFRKGMSAKLKFQAWVYIIFYACVVVSLTTGLIIEFGPKTWKDPMEEIHVLSIYYFVTFLVLHFAGVLIADSTNQKGIISRMIGGKPTTGDQ